MGSGIRIRDKIETSLHLLGRDSGVTLANKQHTVSQTYERGDATSAHTQDTESLNTR